MSATIVLAEGPNYEIREVEGGVLVVKVMGDVDSPAIARFYAAYQPIMEARAPVRALIDISGLGDISMSARWDVAMTMKKNRALVQRSAVVGLSAALETMARVVIRASGRQDVHFYQDPADALAWLGAG